jgi:bisphosphoglycerate-independent phosphoglycerate mutase (AlkP superfamily)
MINPDGSPNTAHTTNPVPIILVDKELKNINNGVLGDIAPTILELMGSKTRCDDSAFSTLKHTLHDNKGYSNRIAFIIK